MIGSRPARRVRLAGAVTLLTIMAGLGTLRAEPAAAESVTSDRAIRMQQSRLERNPYDAGSYHRLADAYIQKARETGDLSYFDLAEQALQKSLDLAPGNAAALRHLAFVSSSRHDFEQAIIQATRALQIAPGDGDAQGVLGDALLELGRYDEAEAAYARMMEVKHDLASLSRRSGLRVLRADTRGAMADLERAIDDGMASGQPRESVAWALWQLGEEHFSVGDLGGALARYEEAGRTYPNYHRALAGLGRVRAAQQRYSEAIDLYRSAMGVIPLPEYAASLGDIYAKLGRSGEAQQQYELVEHIARLNALNRSVYNRELAYFYADHNIRPAAALDLARREIEVRKDIYGYDALAWALYKSGHAEEAAANMKEALRLGTRDARLFFHAGMISARLGETDSAIRFLEQALAINPHFHVLQADEARATLKGLRETSRSAASNRGRDG